MTSSSTASVYAAFRETAYFPSLNGIRAICALMVIKVHTHWFVDGEPQMIEWGYLGVDMFFVISGFLIVTLLLRERDRAGRIGLRQFYVRRTLRIFPIYYLLIAVLFVLAVATYRHSSKTWDLYKWSFPVLMLYLQDFVPAFLGVLNSTWSLSMEEQFYLVWPSVERFMRSSWIVPTLLLLVLLNQLCNFGVFGGLLTRIYGPEGVQRPAFIITFTPILLGVLAAHAMHDRRGGLALTGFLKNRWMPPLLMSLAMLVCQYSNGLRGIAYPTVHVLFCLALLAMVINPRGIFSRTLQSRVLSYLGSISYGIYLYHTLIIWVIERVCESRHVRLTPLQLFLVVAPLAIAVAGLSFKYFEKPIMRLRHRQPATGALPIARQGA